MFHRAILALLWAVAGCGDDARRGRTLSSIADEHVLRVTTDAINETSATSSPRRLIVDLREEERSALTAGDRFGPDICPTFHARATVSGIELTIAHAGQRAAVNTGDLEGYYECQGPRFELDLVENAEILSERVLEVTVEDDSAVFRARVVNLFHTLRLDWGEKVRSRALRSGDLVAITVDPAPDPREHEAAVRFMDPSSPDSLFELRSERDEVRVTSHGVEFVVPEFDVEATEGLLQAEGAALATGIASCEGPHECTVAGRNMRWLPVWRSVVVSP